IYHVFFSMTPLPSRSTLFPYTTLFRSIAALARGARRAEEGKGEGRERKRIDRRHEAIMQLGEELARQLLIGLVVLVRPHQFPERSEEHTSNSSHLVISYAVFCLKKKKI